MSSNNPTNSKSYRPGDENIGGTQFVRIELTQRECSDLMKFITEFTMGSFAPSSDDWKWLEDVLGFPTRDSLDALSEKINRCSESQYQSTIS